MITPGFLAVIIAPRGVALLLDLCAGPICTLQEGSMALVVGLHPEGSAGNGALFMVVAEGRAGWVRRYNLRFV